MLDAPTNATDPSGMVGRFDEAYYKSTSLPELERHLKAGVITQTEFGIRQHILKALLKTGGVPYDNAVEGGTIDPTFFKGGSLWTPADGKTYGQAIDSIYSANSKTNLLCNDACAITRAKALLDFWRGPNGADEKLVSAVMAKWLDYDRWDALYIEPPYPAGRTHFVPTDLVPGDQTWFRNPYALFFTATEWQEKDFRGYEGSNCFYVGGGRFASVYRPLDMFTYDEKRTDIINWPPSKLARQRAADPNLRIGYEKTYATYNDRLAGIRFDQLFPKSGSPPLSVAELANRVTVSAK